MLHSFVSFKIKLFIGIFALFAALAIVNVNNVFASTTSSIPGSVEGEGTRFDITDSMYLNISLTSSESVKAYIESIPDMITIGLGPSESATSTNISINGLLPLTTYYKYQDDYHNLQVLTTDENGIYNYTQDLSERHIVFIQTVRSTRFINNDSHGGDCSNIGTWNQATLTCTLGQDVNETIQINANNITFDGAGHTVNGSYTGEGIYVIYSGDTIKNLTVQHFTSGIAAFFANNTRLENVTATANSIGLNIRSATNTVVVKNNFTNNSNYGIFIGWYYAGSPSINTQVYNNNFERDYSYIIGDIIVGPSEGTTLSLDPPIGGNYFDHYDTPAEGCVDANADGMCDSGWDVGSGFYDYHPWASRDGWNTPPQVPTRNPVLLIPGILGTQLLDPGIVGSDKLVWPNTDQILSDHGAEMKNSLMLNSTTGESINPIDVGDIVRRVTVEYPPKYHIITISDSDIFQGLINDLVADGYVENTNLFVFPYDWRLDIDQAKIQLNDKINQIKEQTGSDKIDIVAHSMGGLVVKDYLKDYGNGRVGKLIFVGTPHLGAPEPANTLINGDNFKGAVDAESIKDIADNSSATYELLPSQRYFNLNNGYNGYISLPDGTIITSYNDTKNFLLQEGLNPNIYSIAENFFSKDLEDINLQGIDAYNIVGCKINTPTNYSIDENGNFVPNFSNDNGDGTVPSESAAYINIPNDHMLYVKYAEHSELPSADGSRQAIVNALTDKPFSLNDGPNVTVDPSDCGVTGKGGAVFSPLDINIYDNQGRHTGPVENGAIEYGIPGVTYEIIGHEKFFFLPTDQGQTYTINGQGTDSGTFDFRLSTINNNTVTDTKVFNDVPVTTATSVSFAASAISTDDAITVTEGNNAPQTLNATSTVTGSGVDDYTPPITTATVTGPQDASGTYTATVNVSLSATDDASGVMVTKYSLDSGVTFQTYTNPITLDKSGTTEFEYYSIDNSGNDETVQTKEIKVAINLPPVASDQSVSAAEETLSPIVLSAVNPEGSPVSYSVTGLPTNGTLYNGVTPLSGCSAVVPCSLTSNAINYLGNVGFVGTDGFTFAASDGSLTSNQATVTVEVVAILDTTQALNAVQILPSGKGILVGNNGISSRWLNNVGWTPMATPMTDNINGVSMVSDSFGFEVGDKGQILQWNGTAWSSVVSPTTKKLNAVSMISVTDGFAIGAGGTIIRWNGTAWNTTVSPTNKGLSGIWMLSSTAGFAVGDKGTIIGWNGTTWSAQVSTTNANLNGVYALSSTDAFVVGASGTILRWNGTAWSAMTSTVNSAFNAIYAINDNNIFAVGSSGTIVQWDGTAWNELPSPTERNLNSIWMMSANDGFIVGNAGEILRFDAEGWTDDLSQTDTRLNSVDVVSPTAAFAVGRRGTLLNWDGMAWNQGTSPTGRSYNGVSMLSAIDGFAVGDNGTAVRWDGTNWNALTMTTKKTLMAVSMLSSTDGVAVGNAGTILRWNGVVWNAMASPTTNTLRAVSMRTGSDGMAVGNGGTVLRWNGTTWTAMNSGTTETLYGIKMLAANDVWAIGADGTIIHWSGTIWSMVSSSLTGNLFAITMDTATDGYIVGAGGKIIHWNSVYWAMVPSPTKRALYGVDMLDSSNGFAVGGQGMVVRRANGNGWVGL